MPRRGAPPGTAGREISSAALNIIRLALIAAVALLGVVAWLLHARGVLSPSAPVPALRFVILALSALAVVEVLIVRIYRARQASFAAKVPLTIAGWALGEAPALLGGVHFLLSGTPELYWAGCSAFLIALVLLPVPEGGRP